MVGAMATLFNVAMWRDMMRNSVHILLLDRVEKSAKSPEKHVETFDIVTDKCQKSEHSQHRSLTDHHRSPKHVCHDLGD
jgi:hypothetical protein